MEAILRLCADPAGKKRLVHFPGLEPALGAGGIPRIAGNLDAYIIARPGLQRDGQRFPARIEIPRILFIQNLPEGRIRRGKQAAFGASPAPGIAHLPGYVYPRQFKAEGLRDAVDFQIIDFHAFAP